VLQEAREEVMPAVGDHRGGTVQRRGALGVEGPVAWSALAWRAAYWARLGFVVFVARSGSLVNGCQELGGTRRSSPLVGDPLAR
jgi:hypothetical protein